MRPKRNILVVGIRPELRCMLRIVSRQNVFAAESMTEVEVIRRETSIDLVIIDWRDLPLLAEAAVDYFAKTVGWQPKTMLLALANVDTNEPVCDYVVRDYDRRFWTDLYFAVKVALIRKRGPMKGALCR
jgi:hypothetical protein